jgi:hypothetical protein
MKLSDLFLNRWLYRDNNQNLETKGADFASLDSMDTEPASIPSGGAAQDINTGNVTINGQQLTPGTYPVTVLDVSNWGWGQTCAFSSTDEDTVSWGIGVFKSASGVSYNISAGNTGNMAAKTYIYLDLLVSETAYQTTTTPANAVGIGKVLIAVADKATAPNLATYNLSEAIQIVGDNILANSINASKIVAGSITTTQLNFTPVTSTNVVASINASAEGIQISGARIAISGSTTFSAGYDPTTKLPTASAGNLAYLNTVGNAQIDNGAVEDAKLGTTVIVGGYIKTTLLTADNIQAGTLTGRTVRTASSGTRIVLSGATNEIQIYNGSTLRALGYQNGWSYYNSSSVEIGAIYASGSDFLLAADLTSTGKMYYGAGSSGSHSMHIGTGSSTIRFYVDDDEMWLGDVDDFSFDVDVFGELKLNNGLFMDFAGSVSAGGTATGGTNAGSVSVSKSTGVYTITHYMGTANFTVLVTLRNATAVLLVTVSQKSSTTFTVRIGDVAGNLTDAAFDFACFKWN